MMKTNTMHFLSVLVLSSLSSAALDCRPEGPVVPKPVISRLESSKILSAAADNLSSILDNAISGSINAGWKTTNVSFSLALVSADQERPDVPLWEYHHLAEANTNGTTHLDRDSQYLIGSVTKLISDYVLLQTGIDLDAPVTEYLPKLGELGSRIQWEGVTLRKLADHLSGAPTNYGFSESYYLKEAFLSYGLPPIRDSAYPPCGVGGLNGACTPDQILDGMRDAYPVAAINERPAYSNIAFAVILMALENTTGKNYTELVDEHFAKPLGLENTFPSPGDDIKAVIPPGDSSWGSDYGYNTPAGGLVSTLSDLTKFAHGILSRSIPMTESEIRGWMKPSSFAGGAYSFVGMPWEIYRPVDLTPDHPHAITVYAKSGGAMGYRSQWSLVDEYGVGIIVLAAGPPEAIALLYGAMMTTFVPAVDEISRADTEKAYARTFISENSDRGNDNNSTVISATFSLDEDSLIVKELAKGETDILSSILEIFTLTVAPFGFPVVAPVRLFPGDLKEETELRDGTKVTREVWRIWPDVKAQTESELPGADYAEKDCTAWMFSDWVHYGGEPLDRFLFYRDQEGEVVGFEAPFLRSGILRPVQVR